MRIQYYLACICMLLFGAANLQAQTQSQYVGPNNGDWFDEDNWLPKVLPGLGNNAFIGGDVTVVVGSPLTVNFNITAFGNISASAAVTVAVGGSISNSGTLAIASTGSLTNNATVQNFGTMTFAGAAGFTNGTGASFTNGGSFTLLTTLVNQGTIINNGTIDATNGTLQSGGSFNNNQTLTTKSLTINSGSTFTNDFGSVLNITTATGLLQVNGTFTNNGAVNAAGVMTVAGTFNNNVTLNVATATVLTINAAAQLTNVGTLDNSGFLQINGTFTNGQTLINKGEVNNFATFNNNNLIDNRTGGNFFNRTAGTLGMGFGSKILNAGTFTNQGAINSFGTIENNRSFINSGTLLSFGGSLIDNNSTFTNNNTLSTNDVVSNDGPFTNSGTINVNGGSVWSNNASFTNSIGATVNVLQDFNNKATGTLTNNGKFNNTVRTSNEGGFVNNAFLFNPGDFTNAVGGTLTNNELFLLQAGNLLNAGAFVNTDKTFLDGCSSVRNTGSINNTGGNLELHGILFQKGSVTGNAVNNQGGYIHTAATSAAPTVCQNGTYGADINGDIKVYAGSLVSFANFDSCSNIIYLANGIDRPVFTCANIPTIQNVNLVVRTRLGDELTCVAQVTPVDLLAPQFSGCPKDQTIFTPNATTTATWTAPTATDNCSTVTTTTTHTSGASFPVGITGVTYTFKDIYNNQNQCQFRIDVRQTPPGSNCTGDATAPTFTGCPTNVSTPKLANLTPATWTVPTPSDNCKPINLTATHVPGQGFPAGTTTVTYTAKDGNNNSGTCSFTVTVTTVDPCLNDTQKPIISGCPANIFLPTNTAINGAVAIWNAPGAGDNCGVANFTASQTQGAVFPVATTTVTYTATDAANNSATCSFTITVGVDPCPGDVTAPAISGCPANISLLTTGTSATATWTAPTATDACAPVTVNSTHAPGATFPLGVTGVSYQFSDKKGNRSTCNFTVTVQNSCSVDNVPPVITGCPANITVAATGAGGATATWAAPTATDNCGLSSFTASYQPGANFPVGTTTVVYSAIDIKGNGSNCSFNVVVVTGPGCTTNAAPINNTTGVNPASVALSWNSATNASSYDLYLGTTNPPTTLNAASVTGTSRTVTGLVGGTVYYWYVVPKNAAGSATGCASSATSFTTQAVTPPGCNKNALFVVGATTLNAGDAAVKARLESLGYNVTVKTDVLAATADATGKGLVLISSTTLSTNVGTKFTNVAVPVINYEPYLFDELKMANLTAETDFGSTAGITQMVVQNAAHPLAAGLSGTVTLLTAANTVTWAVPAASAAKVGYVPGNTTRFMSFGYDTGNAMFGLNAPARRVGLYLHDLTASTWNADGIKLFDAAIFWATGCTPCTPAPTAICKSISLQLTAIGQSVQITGQQVDNGSTPGCTGTITSYNVSPTSFSQAGTYTVTLTVTNSLGLSSTCTSLVTVSAPACSNVTNGGTIGKACSANQVSLTNATLPTGGAGTIEYMWISGTVDCNTDNMTAVAGANAATLTVAPSAPTRYYIRCSRRSGCTNWDGESNCITVNPNECAPASTCAGNLLVSPGFEGGTGGWTWMQNAGTTTTSPYAGTKSLQICTASGGISQSIPALPGSVYTLKAYAKISGATGSVGLRFYDANWVELSVPSTPVTATSFTLYTVTATAPVNVAYVEAWVWKNTNGCLTADDFCLTSSTGFPACSTNLLAAENPGFENNMTSWDWVNNATSTTTNIHGGTKAAQVCTSAGGAGNRILATPGATYSLQLWAKISGTPAWAGATIAFYNASNVKIGTETSRGITATDWSLYLVQGVAPINAKYVEFSFWKETGGCLYVDDFCASSTGGGSACNPNALFVVGNTTLNAGDAWVKTRLEQLGLTVTVKSATAALATDATGKGVVVISSTINSGDVTNKFTNVTVPVVTWESYILDDMKMTGNSAQTDYGQDGNFNSLVINDAGHPLSAGLSGTVQVLTTPSLMRWGWTTASSAAKAAKVSGQASWYGSFGFAQGAAMHGGFVAPARRVSIFLDDATPSLLTANGIKLFDAAIEWAVGCNLATMGSEVVADRNNEAGSNLVDVASTGTSVQVYPNPTEDRIYLEFGEGQNEEAIVRLFDINGKAMKEWQIAASADPVELQLDGLRSGQYLLWIAAEGKEPVSRRIIVANTN